MSTALRWYAQERAPELASEMQIGFAVDHLLRFFKTAAVSALTPQVIKRYEAQRAAKGIARGTIRRELAVLSAAIGHAVKNGRLLSAPKIALPPPGKPRTAHLDEAEIARLLEACRASPHLHLFVMLALNTAARKSALLELTWMQVQLEQDLIYLNPAEREQTSKGRAVVPISDSLRAALAEAAARRTCPYVIEYRGARILDIKKSFAQACARAGLIGVSPHTLRHTAGTLMARGGVELFLIAKVLGHSVAKTTELYAHHRPQWLRAGVEILGRATAKFLPAESPGKKNKGLPDDR